MYERNVTEDGPTDAHGEILFLGHENTSKFVKLSVFTPGKQILDLLYSKTYWNLKKPNLLISKHFELFACRNLFLGTERK